MFFKGSRYTFKNVCKQVNGRWLRESGWIIPSKDVEMFTRILNIAFPEVSLVEALADTAEVEVDTEAPVIKEESDEFVPNPVIDEEVVSTIYRARSAKKVASRSRIKPRERKVLLDDEDIALSSSSGEESDSDSSADYPSKSPSRKGYINESAISKMNMANRRLLELELEDKK